MIALMFALGLGVVGSAAYIYLAYPATSSNERGVRESAWRSMVTVDKRPVSVQNRPPMVARVALVSAASIAGWLLVVWLSEGAYAGLSDDAQHAASAATVFALAVPLVVLVRRHLDQRPWAGLRLAGPREGWRPFVVGVVAWLGPAAVLLAVVVPLGLVEIEVTASVSEVISRLLLLVLLVLVYEAFPEELLVRGYLYRNLVTVLAPWVAVGAQAALFAALGASLTVAADGVGALGERLPFLAGMGVVLGIVRVMTGDLWVCVGYHLAFQVVAQALLSDRHAVFSVEGESMLTLLVFSGAFALVYPMLTLLAPREVNWTEAEVE